MALKHDFVGLVGRAKARYHRSRLSDIRGAIEAYERRTASTGAKPSTLFHLYHGILRKKPQAVLECGTGLTTVVICEAIKALRRQDPAYAPIFVSMESEPFYFRHAMELLPGEYRGMVEILLSPVVEDAHAMFRGMRYANVPDHAYDFVFVDGPSYSAEQGGYAFCFDFIRALRGGAASVDAVIDTRVSTVYVLQQLLGTRRVRYDPYARVGLVRSAALADLVSLSEPPSAYFETSLAFDPGRVRLTPPRP